MPNHTFPCPFCGKKMGVGHELLGKKVRCPHCNQILAAPKSPAAPPPQPKPDPKTPSPEPAADLPVFQLPNPESRDSIFGESVDETDDVFDSTGATKAQIPDVPREPLPAPASPKTSEAAYGPTLEIASPFARPPGASLPVSTKPTPTPVPVTPAPIGATPVSSATGTNPWAGLDELPAPPAPAAVPTLIPVPVPASESPFSTVQDEPKAKKNSQREAPIEVDDDRAGRRLRATQAAAEKPIFKIGVFILAPYALLMTVLAIYGLFFKSSTPPGHPLSTIPDNFGEFPPAERKKTSKANLSLGGELPPEQRIALGAGKIEIGQLEIEPTKIEQRTLNVVTEGKNAKEKQVQQGNTPALVLSLRIKNTSGDLFIHPLDPAFNRKPTGNERPGTGVLIGNKQAFWGGAIAWPFSERVNRVYETAQEADATPLKPGDSHDYVVFTDARPSVVKAVKESKETIFWRIQVRTGRVGFEGKDIPVTAIISVEFKSSDVKED